MNNNDHGWFLILVSLLPTHRQTDTYMHILYSSSLFLVLKPHPCTGDWKGPCTCWANIVLLYYRQVWSFVHFFFQRQAFINWPRLAFTSLFSVCMSWIWEKSPASACHIAGITGLVRPGLFSFMYYVYINEW